MQFFVFSIAGKTANLYNSQDECNTACGPDPSGKTKTIELFFSVG